MPYGTILVEKKVEDRIGIITLNRPEVRNAINQTMREELSKALSALVQKATGERVDSGSREAASRELFRTLRTLFDSIPR